MFFVDLFAVWGGQELSQRLPRASDMNLVQIYIFRTVLEPANRFFIRLLDFGTHLDASGPEFCSRSLLRIGGLEPQIGGLRPRLMV